MEAFEGRGEGGGRTSRGAPQDGQKREPLRARVPQRGQVINDCSMLYASHRPPLELVMPRAHELALKFGDGGVAQRGIVFVRFG